jgi:YggT family protein
MLQQLLRAISSLISIYMILIFVRIMLTWFHTGQTGRVVYYLSRATDPYLNYFRRIPLFRESMVDFSPILAILTLSIVNNVLTRVAYAGTVTLGFVLAMILSAVVSAASFVIFFILIIAIIRLVGFLTRANTATPFWVSLDRILQPLAHNLIDKFGGGRSTTYQNALMIFAASALLILLVGNFLAGTLMTFLLQLPI